MDYIIHNTPNWLFEAAACLSEQYLEREDEIIENHNKFGMTKEEMIDFFAQYRAYKKAVLDEILPIYNNYPSLKWLFEPAEFEIEEDTCIGLSLVSFWGNQVSLGINGNDNDKILIKFILNTISDYAIGTFENDLSINSLSDLVEILENISISETFKMKLIKLYHNRYEIIKKLWEMIYLCVPICQKYFYIIKEDFEKSLNTLATTDNLEKLLNSSVGIKISTPIKCNVFPTIFCFNSYRIEFHDDINFNYLGIYFFLIVDLKEKNRFNDIEMIADLKALGDSTRLKMIHILSEKNMYLQELAEYLSLTPATVSHHINILLKSSLISITIRDENTRKVFYEVNRAKLESMGESIKNLATIIK